MPAVLEDTYTVILDELDFDPPCEGTNHEEGKYGHRPGTPAEFIVTAPCGWTRLMCRGWVEYPAAVVRCRHGKTHRWEEMDVKPIRRK